MRVAPWAAAALLLAACAPATKPETAQQTTARLRAESDSARTAIEAADARFVRALAAGQADSAAPNYAEDAVVYFVNEPPTQGRAAILEKFRGMLAAGAWTANVMIVKVEASGPLAVETGRNILTYTPGPNAPAAMKEAVTDTIAYVTTWRRTDGQWLIANDISVSTKAPQPAPARRR